jgi:plasmid maintenance system antidote protein VapI
MNNSADFEDLLALFREHHVRYLIVGGLAFIFHAKPRYTKDMDLWVEGSAENIARTNRALTEFGSPTLLDFNAPQQVVQIGVEPNRIDILIEMEPLSFAEAWGKRLESPYGGSQAFWIDIESLWQVKNAIEHPRHREDARVLRQIIDRQTESGSNRG